MAQRGARTLRAEGSGTPDTDRNALDRERQRGARPPRPQPWVRDDGSRNEWEDAPKRAPAGRRNSARAEADAVPARERATSRPHATGPTGPGSARIALAALSNRYTLPPEVSADIRNAADLATARHREWLVGKAESAFGAYERGRYLDSLRAIKPVADETPHVAAVRELAGLAAYRAGRWREAVRHLEAHAAMTDVLDHHPVRMDCLRALHRPRAVADLWTELRHGSPEPDVLAEGRIVAASSLADTGDLQGAIALLASAGAGRSLRNPSDRHIRQWYVLGDLYERAGDVPKARDLFTRVARVDPAAYDVAVRLAGLGPERTRARRPPSLSRRPAASAKKDTASK